jgi:hypothetical protein
VRGVQAQIEPAIRVWANQWFAGISPSGSFAKGTANKSGTDIDLFISVSQDIRKTLKEIYDTLFQRMIAIGYTPKRQNVSINVKVNGYSVDLVPAKRQALFGSDHSLYRSKRDTWTKTNVTTHINYVRQGLRSSESRVIKLWRDQMRLDFPSFYLELTVIDALAGHYFNTLANNVWSVFLYLRDKFSNARVIDPANTNNIISDDLTVAERCKIRTAAEQAIKATNWDQVVT